MTPEQLAEIERRLVTDQSDDADALARHAREDVPALIAAVHQAREIAVALEQEVARLECIVGAVANLQGRRGVLDNDTQPRHWISLNALSDRVRCVDTPALPAPDDARLRRLDGLVAALRRLCDTMREHPDHGEVYADILDRIEQAFPLPTAALNGGEDR